MLKILIIQNSFIVDVFRSERCRYEMVDCFENLVVEVSPHQPNPKNSGTADENLRNVNFPHRYIQ